MAQTGHKRLVSVDKGRPPPATSASASAEQGKFETPTASTGNSARPLSPRTNLSHVPAGPAERPSSRDLDFLNNLIVFALRLRNAGLSDHGLIVHLSEAVAGSLYGTGHSTIYEENEVYALSFKWLLTTNPVRPGSRRSSLSGDSEASPPESSRQREWRRSARFLDLPQRFTEPLHEQQQSRLSLPAALPRASLEATPQMLTPPVYESQLEYFSASNPLNPYYLPWIIRALLGDPLVAAHPDLAAELQGIIQQFRDWEPKEKALRDLKYRLEPLKSHL
ncbi:MAG: hypothetical protein BJ554DRAFT_4669 [Olpidium bornovanus]|uniref:YMC020W-like alpha/beta hydrolase domain-containing protein n=1 Tax=Olpidium bornovanus TaxID=278681 RepID=A0A8H8DLC4_9FUNG|nr:MAG: hypothetical protein BJ554DRAFT_4669 [Olpidium bornovanus]